MEVEFLDHSLPLLSTLQRTSKTQTGKKENQTLKDYLLLGLRLVYPHHLRQTGSFSPPLSSAASCWDALQSSISGFLPRFDVRSRCGFQSPWISQGCMNITTRSQFEAMIPNSTLSTAVMRCNLSLESNTPCASCTQSLSAFQAYLTEKRIIKH
ncbi:putative LRR receptor-like serine/threonine-protein kinase RKF3 [Raphanus sativus]|nr:putative LRR receptor-like serine/threonine-protein kinase RKF3 [Raphanus sativus]